MALELTQRAEDPEAVQRRANDAARHLAMILGQTAKALEESAVVAERAARRQQRAGRATDAANTHCVAMRAREAARDARSQAGDWWRLVGDQWRMQGGGPSLSRSQLRSVVCEEATFMLASTGLVAA